MMYSRPSITLCVNTRNEERNIIRCLDSARPVVDEMIVVDTGSTDRTVALAGEAGAAVSFFPWCDDFAAARNAAVAQASGTWILWLDADEALLPESQPLVRKLAGREDALAYLVQRQEVERKDQTGGFVEMRQLRLWRNEPEVRFIGRDHAHFGSTLEEAGRRTGRRVLDSPVRIRHWGYLPDLSRSKLERAQRLLQLELAERPGQFYYEVELGRTWCLLNDPRGPELLNRLLESLPGEAGGSRPPSILAATLLEYGLRAADAASERTQAMIRLADRWFPDSPPLLTAISEIYFNAGEFERAIPYYERLVRLAQTGEYDRSTAFPAHLLADGPLLYLAVCHHRLAHFAAAERAYYRLLERYPGHPSALQNLEVLQRQREELDGCLLSSQRKKQKLARKGRRR
jgi:glycosyltransferase involved in cell wall biosynthesis